MPSLCRYAALVAEDRIFVAREEVKFLGRGEGPQRFRASGAGPGLALVRGLSSCKADEDELDMVRVFLVLALQQTVDLL